MILITANIEAAMAGPRMGALDETSVRDSIERILTDLYVLAGYDPQLNDQVDDLARDLRNSFRHLTTDEVKLAGKAGIAGELGDIRRPSYASVMRWVEAYDRSAQVTDARRIVRERPAMPVRISDAEGLERMRRIMPDAARRRWDDIRVNGAFSKATIPHVSAQLYDWLREEGVLHLDKADKEAAVMMARKESNNNSVWDVSHLEGGEALIRSRAKHIALQTWMRKTYAAGQTLTLPTQIRRIYN
jgi:hypothetical protein